MTCHSDRETWAARHYEVEFRDLGGHWSVRLRHSARGILFSGHAFEARIQAVALFESLKKGIKAGFWEDIDLP